MKKILTVVCIILIPFMSLSQRLEKQIVLDKKIEMMLPASFSDPQLIETDTSKRSWRILHKDGIIMIIYHPTLVPTTMAEADDNAIPEITDKQLSGITNNPRVKYIDDGIFLQNGKNIGYIKYSMRQPDAWDTYHLNFFIASNGQLFNFVFFCPKKLRKKWAPIADDIANSLRIIEKN